MATDDATRRKQRADQIHDMIDSMKPGKTPVRPAPAAPAPESPAEFIHRRMRELDAPTAKTKKKSP